MAKYNLYLVIAVLSLLVIISGCINSNETTQKTTNESKIINLDSQQLILTENEVRQILGTDWKKGYKNNSISVSKQNYDKGQFIGNVLTAVYVYPNITEAKQNYDIFEYYQNLGQLLNQGNDINIGDHGRIFVEKVFTLDSTENEVSIKVMFRKNNIISIINIYRKEDDLLTIETAIELAKKQDAKISRILDMIK